MNEIINNPILWLICSVTVIIVALQAGLFVRLALRNAESFELSRAQCLKAFRIGMVTAFGPSLGILIVMVGLMTVLGEPLTWMRLSMIVSAANELTAAQIGAQAVGIEFNSPDFGTAALFVAWLGMAVNGIGSLVGALAFSGSSDRFIWSSHLNSARARLIALSLYWAAGCPFAMSIACAASLKTTTPSRTSSLSGSPRCSFGVT